LGMDLGSNHRGWIYGQNREIPKPMMMRSTSQLVDVPSSNRRGGTTERLIEP